MEFLVKKPLHGLDMREQGNSLKLFDCHVHIWHHWFFKDFLSLINIYDVSKMLGIAQPKIKKRLEKQSFAENIVFAYFLSARAFAKLDIPKLLAQVDEAQEKDYSVIKIFFGPRFLDFNAKYDKPYRINDPQLDPVYSRIEDYGMKVLIHVADPDYWYQHKYTNQNKYGTKQDRLDDFVELVEQYTKITWISAHLGCLPENLPQLSDLLDRYPRLYVDTGSTRWMIRELGKNIPNTQKWIKKYQDRILWGSDISSFQLLPRPSFLFRKSRRKQFWGTRYWSHRLFWETSHQAPLPFADNDNPDGTQIHGLNLPEAILHKIYYNNAKNLLKLS